MPQPKYETVISGMSGKFPDCESVNELKEKLFSKQVLLKEDPIKWSIYGKNETYFAAGKIPNRDRFDGSFFGITSKYVPLCDPLLGTMLERVFESLVDAGVNPFSFRGRNIMVIVALSSSDGDSYMYDWEHFVEGFGLVGHSRAMMANRISYFFNFTGQSVTVDSNWVALADSLEQAATMVSQGRVEGAVVVAANLVTHKCIDIEYKGFGILSKDGQCMPFDESGHGFVRSEATVSFFIQRAADAKRKYCSVELAWSQFVGDKRASFVRMSDNIDDHLRPIYQESQIDPRTVAYVEGMFCYNKDNDSQELNGLANLFCRDDKPLLVGSTAGNLGNGESTSGFVSLVKVIIAMESGILPPTINYQKPNTRVPDLVCGRIKPVTSSTPLPGDIAVISCSSLTGALGHVVVKRSSKERPSVVPRDDLPRLITTMARHEDGIRHVLEKVKAMKPEPEVVAMINDVFKTPISNYLWRGYTILSEQTVEAQGYQLLNSSKRPVWYVFPGMGSQWLGMGRDLLRLPVFAASIDRCARVLRPRGLDLYHILTTDDPHIFDNIINSFVGIASIQVGLVDVLASIGVAPDGILGHSVGETACAYADGCFTAEQTVLVAYSRGKASVEAKVIPGMMASVGLGHKDIQQFNPPATIDMACHNSPENTTISGPTEDVVRFVQQLQDSGVFNKLVSVGGIPFHSRYIGVIASKLLVYLKELIPEPKPRSNKWVSSSVPQDQWNTPDYRLSSAEYHVNNLLSPVLFAEATTHIPKDAILVEIGPRGLLQAILRRSISSDCYVIPLTSHTVQSNLNHLLIAIGKLHLHGVDVDVNALYPKIEYPVPRGTPGLSDLVTWDHSVDHSKVYWDGLIKEMNKDLLETTKPVSSESADYRLWKNYRLVDREVVPVSQILIYAWDTINLVKRFKFDEEPLVFEDVTVKQNLFVRGPEDNILITVTPVTTNFEVTLVLSELVPLSDRNVLTGRVHFDVGPLREHTLTKELTDKEVVSQEDIYSHLESYGHHYGTPLQTILEVEVGVQGCLARVKWTGSIVVFLESLFTTIIFLNIHKKKVPLRVSTFKSLMMDHKQLTRLPTGSEVVVHYDFRTNIAVCPGVELVGLTVIPATVEGGNCNLRWRELKLIPYFVTTETMKEFFWSCDKLVADCGLAAWRGKCPRKEVVIIGSTTKTARYEYVLQSIKKYLKELKYYWTEENMKQAKERIATNERDVLLYIGELTTIRELTTTTPHHSKVYYISYMGDEEELEEEENLKTIFTHHSAEGKLALATRKYTDSRTNCIVIEGSHWLQELRQLAIDDESVPIVVFCHTLSPSQVLPILARESYVTRVRSFFFLDEDSQAFSVTSPPYSNMLSLGLAVNILKGGVWNFLSNVDLQIPPVDNTYEPITNCTGANIKYIGLNTTTFTLPTSTVDEDVNMLDYSGLKDGMTVMGVATRDPVYKDMTVDDILAWSLPVSWSLEGATTVPVNYTMAYYCLHLVAKVKVDERVLIHAAMSPLGQALVRVALECHAVVYVTVYSQELTTLLDMFPQINPCHVALLDEGDLSVKMRMMTGKHGMGVIINCFSGDLFQSTVKVMGSYCRFLHLGRISIEDREAIGMHIFFSNRSFYGVTLNSILECPKKSKIQLRDLVTAGIQRKTVQALQKKTFNLVDYSEALRHQNSYVGVEKTILQIENQHQPSSTVKNNNIVNISLVFGMKSQIMIDVAEWAIINGTSRVILFTDETNQNLNYLRRVNRFLQQNKDCIQFTSSSSLDSVESSKSLLTEIKRFGRVSTVFTLQIKGENKRLVNLERASREVLPDLDHWVSLLDEDSSVSEARAAAGLSVCCVRQEGRLRSPSSILPYLRNILLESKGKRRFFTVDDNEKCVVEQNKEPVNNQILPSLTLDDLHVMGLFQSEMSSTSERPTLSPGYNHVRYSLLPVFLIPGLHPASLDPLTRRLINPAFWCSPSLSSKSVLTQATEIVEEILKVQAHRGFNVVGDLWSSAVVLEVGCQLEAKGHRVQLFLMEGGPSMTHERLRGLCDRHKADLATCLIAELLHLPGEITKELGKLQDWEEKLTAGLTLGQVPEAMRTTVGRAMTSLYSQLTALQLFTTPSQLFGGDLTLITHQEITPIHLTLLSEMCQHTPNVKITRDPTYEALLLNPKTASLINGGVYFDWSL